MPEVFLETISKKHFMWFTDSKVMANTGKCRLLLSSDEDHTIEITEWTVKNCEKLCHEINRLPEKCLDIIYNDKTSS